MKTRQNYESEHPDESEIS